MLVSTKSAWLSILVIAAGLAVPALGKDSVSLSGYLGNYSAYFLKTERIRHHRYELGLRQKADINYQLSTFIEARGRFDAALLPDKNAPGQEIGSAVRADEMGEAVLRQAYLDYVGDWMRITAGTQLIDWVEALSSLIAADLTPYDLRHARFGDASDTIEPVTGVKANLDLGELSLEALVVPLPTYARTPAGDNGYGYRAALEAGASNYAIEVDERKNPKTLNHAEAGLRVLGSLDALEWTVLAYRGHHKAPVLELVQDNRARRALVTLTYPRLNTFGVFTSLGHDAIVLRASAVYQPRRRPRLLEQFDDISNDYYEDISRIGLGFDVVFSQHLKLYSEAYLIRTESEGSVEFLDPDAAGVRDDGIVVLRLTNESFEDLELRIDYVGFGPRRGQIVNPVVIGSLQNGLKYELGARLVGAFDDEAPTRIIRDTSHAYASLRWYFDAREQTE